MQEAYSRLLGQNLLFVTASLIAYFISQLWDIWLFHRIRDWYLSWTDPFAYPMMCTVTCFP